MRTKLLIGIAATGIFATIVVGIWVGQSATKASLAKYLSQELPASIVVEAAKSSKLQKDPELFWQLRHLPQDFDAVIANKFRLCDAADKQFVQKSLEDVFSAKFVPELTDVVHGRNNKGFDVFVLTKQQRTNSFVMVLKK
jgi:hypothetical protein